jgi:2-polyprenyl-3-methyl-5-hydroxy-6-metoxy-1,4-benzoquinol methylase
MGWREVDDHPNGQQALRYRHRQLAAARGRFAGNRIKVLQNQARGKKVLDVGCVSHDFHFASGGRGRWLHQHIVEVAAECIGADTDEVGIKAMREAGYDVVQADVTGDVGALRDRGPFDVVIAGEIIEHLPAPQLLLERSRELLRPGGTLVLTTPNPFAPRRARLGALGPTWENVDHVSYLFPSGIAEMADRTGLRLARFGTIGWPHGKPTGTLVAESARLYGRALVERARGRRSRVPRGRLNLPLPVRWPAPMDIVLHAMRGRSGMLAETAVYVLQRPEQP